jgi:hypothetical protein
MPLEITWKQSEPMAHVIHIAQKEYVDRDRRTFPSIIFIAYFFRVSWNIALLKPGILVPIGGSSSNR